MFRMSFRETVRRFVVNQTVNLSMNPVQVVMLFIFKFFRAAFV